MKLILGLGLIFGFAVHAQATIHGKALIASLCENDGACLIRAARYALQSDVIIATNVCSIVNSTREAIPAGTYTDKWAGRTRLLFAPASHTCWQKVGEIFNLQNRCGIQFQEERRNLAELPGFDHEEKLSNLFENYQWCMRISMQATDAVDKREAVSGAVR